MPNIDQYKPEERIFALFISRSKHGKSSAAASFPKPYYQMDIDGRFDGVAGSIAPPYGQGFIQIASPSDVSFDRYYTKAGFGPIQKKLDDWDMERISRQFNKKTIEIASLTTLVQAMTNSSHELQKGKMIGQLRMSGPGDFGFEVQAFKQFLDYLAILPCNVICSAHIIQKWGKPKDADNEYAANEVIGEKLCLRDQPGEVILSCFSNVYRFDKEIVDDKARFTVEFNSEICGNSFGIPPGKFDITGKPFYPFLQDLIKSIKDGTFKAPAPAVKTMNFNPLAGAQIGQP